jgi:hypothetical protein
MKAVRTEKRRKIEIAPASPGEHEKENVAVFAYFCYSFCVCAYMNTYIHKKQAGISK